MPEDITPTYEQRPAGSGPTVGIIIILLLLIVGAFYFWTTHRDQPQDPLPLIPGDATTTL